MRTADRISAILLLLASAFMLVQTDHIKTPAFQILSNKLFPQVIFWLIIVLALVLLAQTFVKGAVTALPRGYWRQTVGNRRLLSAALVGIYILLMPVVGFLPASAGFVVVMTAAVSNNRKRDVPIALAVAAGVAGLIWLVFVYWLQVFLP